jgi:Flp pilus assembly protein TadB
MTTIFAQDASVVTTGSVNSWVDAPMAVALLFALAGSFFVVIYFLRSRRKK